MDVWTLIKLLEAKGKKRPHEHRDMRIRSNGWGCLMNPDWEGILGIVTPKGRHRSISMYAGVEPPMQ